MLLMVRVVIEPVPIHTHKYPTPLPIHRPSRRPPRSLRRSSALLSRSFSSRCSFCSSRSFLSRSRWRSCCSSRSLWSKKNPGESNRGLFRQPKAQSCQCLFVYVYTRWQFGETDMKSSHVLLRAGQQPNAFQPPKKGQPNKFNISF